MTFWTPDTVRAAMGGTWIHRPPLMELPKDRPADLPPPPLHAPIVGVATDTRTIKSGQVFIALKGENHDGHDYLQKAADAGAPILVVDDPARVPEGGFLPPVGVMKVADCGKALLKLGAAYRKSLKQTKVIAVCGSNGKTTTTRLIDHVLKSALRGTASIKSFNNAIGVPLTILSARENDQYLVCEVGTNSPGEIMQLAEVVQPDVAVITSIGREHLEKLGDIAGVAKEEAAIITYLRPKGLAVATADSPELREHLKRAANLVMFGKSEDATLRLTGLEQDQEGVSFSVNNRLKVRLPLLGEHNALNAIAALAVARRMNIDEVQAAAALEQAGGAEMRMERVEVGGITILNDTYNANPDSMIAGLRTLGAIRKKSTGRCVAILGEMLELGAASDAGHRAVARELWSLKAVDLVVLVGERMEPAREELTALGFPKEKLVYLPDCDEPRDRQIAELLRPDDLVLAKGSRRVRLERVIDGVKAKSDKRPAKIGGVTPELKSGLGSAGVGSGGGGGTIARAALKVR